MKFNYEDKESSGEEVESVNTDDDDERQLNSLRQFSFSRLNIVFIKLSSYQTISDRIKSVSQTRKFAKMQPKRENKRISLFPSEALFLRKNLPSVFVENKEFND